MNPLFFVDPYGLCADSLGVVDFIAKGSEWINDYAFAGASRLDSLLDSNVRAPVDEWSSGVNDWVNDATTAEKMFVSFSPAVAPLLFTEGVGVATLNLSVKATTAATATWVAGQQLYYQGSNLYLQNASQINQKVVEVINGWALPPSNTGKPIEGGAMLIGSWFTREENR